MSNYVEEDEEILKEEIRSVETEDLEVSNVSSLLADQSTVKEESRRMYHCALYSAMYGAITGHLAILKQSLPVGVSHSPSSCPQRLIS